MVKRGLQEGAAARIGRRLTVAPTADDGPPPEAGEKATEPRPVGILSAMAAAAVVDDAAAPGERVTDTEVAKLAPNPENPREDVGDVAELAASIAQGGVLQPLVVVSRAAYLATRPGVVLDPTDAEWVVLIGHRRRAAALHAGVPTVPVVVRDDLADVDNALVTMLVENLQRQDLSPIEEARAFGRLRDRGWSERKISAGTGVSPGQVHKRLTLLRLPAKLVAALDTGQLTVADALRLLELPDDQLAAAWAQSRKEAWRGVKGVVEIRLNLLRTHRQITDLRAAVEAAGVVVIDNPDEEFGAEWWHHRLATERYTVPGVELPGTPKDAPAVPDGVVAQIGSSGGGPVRVEWYSRAPRTATPTPTPGDDPEGGASGGSTPLAGPGGGAAPATPGTPTAGTAGQDEERRRARQQQERQEQQRREAAKAAAEARAAACARLVTGQLDPELAVEVLADTVLVDHTVEPYEVVGLAAEWCQVSLQDYERDDVDDPVAAWLEAQAAAGRLPSRRAAVAVALAEVENALGWGHGWADRAWTARERRHVRRLAAHAGYDLTPEDEQRLGTGEGASAGSTPHAEGTPR